jgi:hypothetical protein
LIVAILIPVQVIIMLAIKKHYNQVADHLRVTHNDLEKAKLDKKFDHTMIVPIASLNKAALNALQYARSITPDVIALNISTDKDQLEKLKIRWEELNTDILLIAKYSTYRAVITPLIQYIDDISKAAGENEKITVLLPQFITHEWYGGILHNQTSFFIRESLLMHKNIIIATYPYHIE